MLVFEKNLVGIAILIVSWIIEGWREHGWKGVGTMKVEVTKVFSSLSVPIVILLGVFFIHLFGTIPYARNLKETDTRKTLEEQVHRLKESPKPIPVDITGRIASEDKEARVALQRVSNELALAQTAVTVISNQWVHATNENASLKDLVRLGDPSNKPLVSLTARATMTLMDTDINKWVFNQTVERIKFTQGNYPFPLLTFAEPGYYTNNHPTSNKHHVTLFCQEMMFSRFGPSNQVTISLRFEWRGNDIFLERLPPNATAADILNELTEVYMRPWHATITNHNAEISGDVQLIANYFVQRKYQIPKQTHHEGGIRYQLSGTNHPVFIEW